MLSQTTDGDYLVRKFLVKSHSENDYSIRYQINLSKLTTSLDGNTKELSDLNAFIEKLMSDTLMHIKAVEITGYASPDGPWKLNEMLAKHRAADFKGYLDQKYDFSKKFDVKWSAVVDNWEMTRASVAQSNIPDKQAVLNIIDGDKWTSAQKEMALKKMPSSWNYLKQDILPPMRRVEMAINYGEGSIVEQRMMIAKPAPAPEPCCVVIEQTNGLIVQMDEPDREIKKEVRHDVREVGKATKAEMKAAAKEIRKAEKLVKKEARQAQKLAKSEARRAEKMVKKADKAARQMAKIQAKADRKAAKAIDKM